MEHILKYFCNNTLSLGEGRGEANYGLGNTVSGSYSSVLGGSGNTVSAAYSYAGVFGQNVSAVASNTFHVECLNACATPLYNPIYPIGTLSYFPAPGGLGFPAGSCIVMIK
jgi:hypothetical protein